jgi:hypothetical protein
MFYIRIVRFNDILRIVKYMFTMYKDTQPLSVFRMLEPWLIQGEGPLLEEAQDKVQINPMLYASITLNHFPWSILNPKNTEKKFYQIQHEKKLK